MGAPVEVPRNAEGRKVKAALVEDDPVHQYNAANNTGIIKAGARKPHPDEGISRSPTPSSPGIISTFFGSMRAHTARYKVLNHPDP